MEEFKKKRTSGKPFGERKSFGRRDDDHKPYGGRRTRSDKPFSGERKTRSDKPHGEHKPFGERKNFGRRDDDRKPFGERRTRSDKPFGGERRTRGEKPFAERKPFDKPKGRKEDGMERMLSRKPQISKMSAPKESAPEKVQEEVRLNKFIANSGVCSRREADTMILAGVVSVNGEVVTELGTKVNVFKDEIRFNGELLRGESKVYIVMNKPKGFVTTTSDSHAEKTVMDLLKNCPSRVFPVGRLDKATTGVLMFTNDGDIAEKLAHPSYDKKKIYQVTLDRALAQEDCDKILSGITLTDGPVKADELEYVDEGDRRKLGIEIHSGKNRIVRRIFESLGYEVKALDRVYFAGLTKKGLKRGEWRYLTDTESNILKMGAYI